MAACKDSAGPNDGPPPAPIAFTVVGHGTVSERFTSEIAVRGNFAYTGTWGQRAVRGNVIKIWNIAGATPLLVDSLDIESASTTGDVQISADGTLLAVASEYNPNGALTLFSLSDPAHPAVLSTFRNLEVAKGVHTVKLARIGTKQYAFLSIDPVLNVPAKLVIVDITTPSAPRQVFAQFMGKPFVHDVFVRDGVMFTALWDDGLTIWDVGGANRGGSPEAPLVLGNVNTVGGNVHNIFWFHDPRNGSKKYAFVGEEQGGKASSGDIHVVDVSNFASPREVAFFRVDSAGTHNFAVDEEAGILYAAFYEGGVRALDIRGNLGTCTAAEKEPSGERCDLAKMKRERGNALDHSNVSIWGVALSATHLYASDMLSGIWKLDNSQLR